MKKMMIFAILVCVVAAFAFAGENFTVQEVKGKVQRDVNSQKVLVKQGDTLDSESFVYVNGVASVVVKNSEGKIFTIKKTGKIADVLKIAAGTLDGTVANVDTNAVSRTVTQSETSSARSSEQAGDVSPDAQ